MTQAQIVQASRPPETTAELDQGAAEQMGKKVDHTWVPGRILLLFHTGRLVNLSGPNLVMEMEMGTARVPQAAAGGAAGLG